MMLRKELSAARGQAKGADIAFTVGPIELDLEIGVTKEGEADAGIRFWVISLGAKGSYEKAQIQHLKLTLTPHHPGGGTSRFPPPGPSHLPRPLAATDESGNSSWDPDHVVIDRFPRLRGPRPTRRRRRGWLEGKRLRSGSEASPNRPSCRVPPRVPATHGWCVPSGLIAGRGQLCDTQIRGPTLPLWMSHFLYRCPRISTQSASG